MEVVGDQWIMKGCRWNSPGCVHTAGELSELIGQLGFLPLFSNSIPGFSVEEHTTPSAWWSGDPEYDPWEWRQLLSEEPGLAYGKFFARKAGFISKEWFPVFANYRRNGYDFDALNDDGLVPFRNRKLIDVFGLDDQMIGKEILSCELKAAAGFGKNGEKNFEGTVTDLQMQTYLVMSSFRRRQNRRGEEYGWSLAALETPETKWGYDFVTSGYAASPDEAWKKIAEQMKRFYPTAEEKSVWQMLGIRYPGESGCMRRGRQHTGCINNSGMGQRQKELEEN